MDPDGAGNPQKKRITKWRYHRLRLEQRRRVELDLLYRLSVRLAETDRIETLAREVANSALAAAGGAFAALLLREASGDWRCAGLAARLGVARDLPLRLGKPAPESLRSLFEQAMQRRDVWVLTSGKTSEAEGTSPEARAWLDDLGVHSLCLVPVGAKEETLGLILLGERRRPERSAYGAETWRLLATIGRLAAGALQRAGYHAALVKAHAEARRRAERMERLVRVGLALNRTLTLEEVGEAVGREALALSGADRVVVYLRRPRPPYVTPLWSFGFSEEHFALVQRYEQDTRLPIKTLLMHPQLLLISDVEEETRYPLMRELARKGGYRALGIFPLVREEQTVGALAVYFDRPHLWETDEVNFLQIFAAQAASALENARLYKALEEAYLETVMVLGMAIEARDSYTGEHSERVVRWAEAVAREMGCSEEEVERVLLAARFHDIGKIGIPDAILRKPGPLTPEEWKVMKMHPVIGERILSKVKRLAPVARIVRHHHERYDGTGYPDGLKGEEIPLGARILAVVDAYSAMLDKRVYKEALSPEEAVAELQRGAGTQFDPQVVEAFLRVLDRERQRAQNKARG